MNDKPEPLNHPFLEASESLDNHCLRRARDHGKRVVGFFCSYAPRELIDTDNIAPFRMRAPTTTTTDLADTYLGFFNCSYTRCLLEAINDDMLDFVDGYVFTAGCDHLRRLYDNLRYLMRPVLCHILDLPHKMHEEAVQWYTEELEALRKEMEKSLNVSLSDEEISESILRTNELRRLIKKIQELRKGPEPKLTGEEMHRIMVSVYSAPAQEAIEALKEIYGMLEEREGRLNHRARLLVMGSQMDDPSYIGAMEGMGALVVGDAFCEGSIQFADEVDEDEPPIKALATRYLRKLSCPRMFEDFDRRYDRVVNSAREFGADGVVLEAMKFCDTWGIDAPLFINRLRSDGIEVLRLEREYTKSGIGQLRTRVQAFMEMLGK